MTDHMEPDHHAVLADWIREMNPEAVFDIDTDLVESGIIDSMQFTELIMLIEELRGQEIDDDEKTLENFATLRAIIRAFFNGASNGSAESAALP